MVEFFKSAKGESYFFCLKKSPSDFRGGFISENLGHVNFEKKSQKQECSLGYIGETPKMKNVLHKFDSIFEPFKGGIFQKCKRRVLLFSILGVSPMFWGFRLCYLRKIPIFESFLKNWYSPKFSLINPPRKLEGIFLGHK